MTFESRLLPTLCTTVLLLLAPRMLRAEDIPGNPIEGFHVRAQNSEVPPDNAIDTISLWVPTQSSALEVSASVLLLQPSSGNPVYSTITNPFPFLSPHWTNRAIDPGFTPAFNIGTRYVFESGCDLRLDWTHLNAFDQGFTRVPNPYALNQLTGPADIQAMGPPFLIGPPVPWASALGIAHYAYDAVNLDAGLFINAGRHVQLRTSAGLQGARINHSLTTTFRSADQTLNFTNVPQSLFTGVGPRLGFDLRYISEQFSLSGALAGSTLIGTRSNRIDFFTTSPFSVMNGLVPNTQSLTSPDSTQVIPSIDTKLAASYDVPLGRMGILKCEAGYQAAVYFNVINQYSLTEVTNAPDLVPIALATEGTTSVYLRTNAEYQSNFFVHGPFLKFSFQF